LKRAVTATAATAAARGYGDASDKANEQDGCETRCRKSSSLVVKVGRHVITVL